MKKLTTQQYWEEYYKTNSILKKEQIISICSVYDKFWELLIKENDANPPKTIVEIGGYPGRYLAYIADKYNLIPASVDYNSDKTKIEEIFKLFNIQKYQIIQADIFEHQPQEQYDIVISNGFIEHFENYDEVLDKHTHYLKPGGTLFVLIPNMKNYIYFYKQMVDKNNLKIHNIKCMKKSVFKSFAKRNQLQQLYLDYFGGFPYSVHQKLNFLQKLIFKIHRIVFKFFLDKFISKYPNKYFSSTLVAIYKK